ncbi:uncharacterized protein LOC115269814 [Aedes albopictus]|uniref:MADF domain-containing protein n=1 Tax=Aedes albopictus TaxID=7160 RepID=A0ABM1ZQX9_AEDAL
MASFEEKLILLVKENPCLYAKSAKDYRNVQKKESIWNAIAVELNKTVDQVKARWRSLRDRFGSLARKQADESRSGAGASSSPAWPLYGELLFLATHMEARPTSSNYSQPCSQSSTQQNSQSEARPPAILEDDLPDHDETAAEEEYDTPTLSSTPTTSRAKKRKADVVDTQMQHLLETVQERVDGWGMKRLRHERFALYLAEQLEHLPLQVARSLEVEFVTKTNSLIDQYESLQYESNDGVV